ncbi:hypothetical protein [Deinococcus indicus]|uniref:hypothetical protein n=1 Tax=Deinococcus indicus TaxID=223556 RepID=UPI0015551921|nr:hypothetical protein [Deinococcus indicus]
MTHSVEQLQVWPLAVRYWGMALLLLAALAWGTVTAGPPCYGCAPVALVDPCAGC